jgi:hypothetical protein
VFFALIFTLFVSHVIPTLPVLSNAEGIWIPQFYRKDARTDLGLKEFMESQIRLCKKFAAPYGMLTPPHNSIHNIQSRAPIFTSKTAISARNPARSTLGTIIAL